MSRQQGTTAFVDSASLHDAFGALRIGRRRDWNEWGGQNLVDVTWLLLSDNLRVLPGPGHRGGFAIPGDEQRLARRLPSLVSGQHAEAVALANTKRWLHSPARPLTSAWEKSRGERASDNWAAQLRELWWPVHANANRGLFNLAYVDSLATLLGVSAKELTRIQIESSKPAVVKAWSRGKGGDDARLAGDAYLAAILVRGKYHEYLARAHQLQLFAHQFRRSLTRPLDSVAIPLSNSERLFVLTLVGSALLEPRADGRVDRWIDNVIRARQAIDAGAIDLRPALDDRDAERKAEDAARAIELPGVARYQVEVLDWALAGNLSLCLALALGPWALIGGLSLKGYKLSRGKTLGEDLALTATTRRNFRRLGKTVAGKLIRPT